MQSAGLTAWAGLSRAIGDVRPGDDHGHSGVDGHKVCFLSSSFLGV
jgi:hypothetical protein